MRVFFTPTFIPRLDLGRLIISFINNRKRSVTADHIGGHRFRAQAGKVVAVSILLNATFHVKHARTTFHQWEHLSILNFTRSRTPFFFSILNWSIRFLHAIFTCTSRQFLIQTPKILRRIMNGEIFECFRARSMFFIHHDPSSRDSCKICSYHTLFILDSYRRRAPVFKGNVARRSVSTIKGMTWDDHVILEAILSLYSIKTSENLYLYLYFSIFLFPSGNP